MDIFLVILLMIMIVVVGILAISLVIKSKQIEYYKIVSKNLSSMRVIQSMFEIMGANINANDKVEELNKVIIDTYKCKNSTIVIYDGSSYIVKATNVEKEYIEAISKITEEPDFKANVAKNVSKYITTTSAKNLNYKSAIERGIKSCMFSPIYHLSTFIGFWIIEDDVINAFDNISKSEIAKLKNNMGVFLENTINENVLELAENTDKQTGFYNNIYLYSKARKTILDHENSAVALLCFNNLSEVNSMYSREVGNKLLLKAVGVIKELTGSDTIHIRYSGARILIIVPNTTVEAVHPSLERILSRIKSDAIEGVNDGFVALTTQVVLKTIKKQNNIESEFQKMLNYIDNMPDTDTIKII